MRAVKLTEPYKLETVEENAPEADGENAVINVSACGVCGSDLHYWEMGCGMDGAPGLIMGHEFSGTVADPGPREDLEPGDRVTCIPLNPCGQCPTCRQGMLQLCPLSVKRPVPGNNASGAFAEQVACRADMLRKLPESITDEEACLVEPAAVALHALRQADFRVGDRILVVGAGPIGLLCASWARLAGAGQVCISEINPRRMRFAEQWPAVDRVLDAREKKLKRHLKEASDGGFEAVLETSASDHGIATAISALLSRGTLVLAGINFSSQAVSTLLFTSKELVQKGSMAYALQEFDTAMDFMADKRLQTLGMVSNRVGLQDLQDTFSHLHENEPEIIKALARP